VLGVAPDEAYAVQRFQLLPGDRLALVTDGMFERNAAEAEIEWLLGTLGHLHPREAVQVLTGAVLHVTGGAVRDDATVLIVDWYGNSRTLPARLPPANATTDEHRAGPARQKLRASVRPWTERPRRPGSASPQAWPPRSCSQQSRMPSQ
ncbi:MAG: serine/threonine-protein phosphatase, partial [Actinomycetota bacterium]|nr:serine/threonine-protein phosphatase [Actinomycetota bacterium]